MNEPTLVGGVSAEDDSKGTLACCGLAFESVRVLLRAGELLKEAGFDVLVVPRHAAGCGVLLQVESQAVDAALSVLARAGIKTTEVVSNAVRREETHEREP